MSMELFYNTNLNLVSLIHTFNPTLNTRYVFSACKLKKIWEQQEGESGERMRPPLGTSASTEKASASLCKLGLQGFLYSQW